MKKMTLSIKTFIFLIFFILPCNAIAAEKPEIFVQMGHTMSIMSVAVSPDGRYVLSGDSHNKIKLWEISSGREIRTLGEPDSSGDAVITFTPDGKYALSGTNDKMKLWEISSGRLIRTYQGHTKAVKSVAVSPDGRYALSGSMDNTMKLWEVSTGREIRTFEGHLYRISSVAFSSDGRYALSGSFDKTMKLWDVSSGKEIRTFQHGSWVNSAAFSPDGKYALSCSGHWMFLWDVASGREIRTFKGHTKDVWTVAFSPDGKYALSGDTDKMVKLWDVAGGREIRTFQGHTKNIWSVTFSPDGRYAFSGSSDHTIKFWDVASGREIRTFQGQVSSILSVAVSPDGKYALSGSEDKTVKLRDVASGREIRTFRGHTGGVWSVAFSPDGRHALSGSSDKTLKLWDVASGREIRTFQGHTGGVWSVAFSPDGKYALSGDTDKMVKLWDVAGGREVRTFHGHKEWVNSVAFSPDGRYAISGAWDNLIKLWDVTNGTEIRTFQGKKYIIHSVAFSPDGKFVLGAADNVAKLWEASSGREVRTFEGHLYGIRSVAFSPDGNYILSGSEDKTLKLWDVTSGREIRTFQGLTSAIRSVAFTPDGKYALSGDYSGVTAIWDVAAGAQIAQTISFTDGEWIVITPEGYYNSSANGDKHLNVRIGNNVYGIENYREAFYRPDLVKLALSGGSLKDFKTLADVKQPPVVTIVDIPKDANKDEAKITLKIVDIGGGIGDVRLYLNGSAVVLDSARGVKIVPTNKKEVLKTYNLKLTNGLNTIRAIAFNADNTMQSNDMLHEITASFKSLTKPSLNAIIVGINEYKNPKLQLKYAVSDAELFESTLKKVTAGLFEKVNIKKLVTKEKTTNENIIKELQAYKALNPDDVFVFFVASHGTVDDGEYFLITSNVGSTRTEKLKTDALPQGMLKELIANIPATKKLIIIDTCSAGALGEAIQVAMLTRGMSEDTAMKILSRAVGSTILSASTSLQEAVEGYQGHGLFTYVLVEGLKGKADKGKTGYVKTTELADYVDSEVPVLAEKVFKKAQYPTISISGQAFPIGKMGK